MKRILPILILMFSFVSFIFSQDYSQIINEFESAGREFNVPPELLKAISFEESRWQHLQFAEGDSVSCVGIPRQYGIMALRDDDWFGHSLREAARLIGEEHLTVKYDRFQNIRGAAAYLRTLYDRLPKPEGVLENSIERWENAIIEYCGIPQRELALQHSLEVLERLAKGFDEHGIIIQSRPMYLRPIQTRVALAAKDWRSKQPALDQPDYPLARWISAAPGHWYTTGYGRYFVVIHDMEGYYLSCISYFQNPSTQASAHYCINGLKDNDSDRPTGDITQMVEEQHWAWHALCWNRYSLGIEHEGFVSNPVWFSVEQYLESAKLVKWMCDRWGIPKDRNHIIAHGEKSNAQWVEWVKLNYPSMDPTCNTHTDPGPLWDWDFFIQMIRQDSTAPKVISQPPAGKIQVYDQISITFDQRMEKNSTEANFKISPSISGTFSWSNKYRTLTFKPDLNWDFATSYLIKIDTNAHNYMNISLDQNGDGKADIYSFTLQTVEKDTIPPVILTTYPRKGSNDISKSAEFVFTFSEPIDFSTLTQSFELKDENANSVGLTSPIATVVSGVCKVVVKPISFLKPQSSYTLTAKTFIKDFAGNALSAGKEIIFITEPTIALVGTVVEGFNSTGDWKQPSYSGSTQNVEAGFSIVTDVKVAGAGAGRISYSFLNPSGGRIREYNSSKPTAEGGTYYGIWVYGDNSGHTLEYWFYYSPGPFVIISIDTINWTGWKLKFIPTSQIPGTARTLAGIVINQVASGSRSGTLYFDEITVGNTITNVESSEKEMLPTSIVLEQNYPNPFNPSTAISYQLSAFNLVRLKIFDILGKEVADLVNAEQPPGRFTVVWNASLFPSGVYYCRMQVGDVVQTRKLLLVK